MFDPYVEQQFRLFVDRNHLSPTTEQQIRDLVATDDTVLDTHSWPEILNLVHSA